MRGLRSKRFQAGVLEYKLGGLDITEVLDLPVAQAREFFASGEAKIPAAVAILGRSPMSGSGT